MKWVLALVGVIVLAFGWHHTSHSQTPTTNNGTPPAIIFFESANETVTMENLELNQQQVTVSWQVFQLRAPFELHLEQYYLKQWRSLLLEDEVLPTSGERDVILSHPVYFGEPMLRLRIVDGDTTIEEQIITFAYHVDEDIRPTIDVFDNNTPAVAHDLLANGTAWVYVWWEVSGRLPGTNLVFEQVLNNGQVISVEEPRQTLWVPSTSMGNMRPVLDGSTIHLQIRIVNMRTGEVYDTAQTTILVTQSPTSSGVARSTATPHPSSSTTSDTIMFTVPTEPINRRESIRLAWDVPEGTDVTISPLIFDHRVSSWLPHFEGEWSDLSAAGSIDVVIPDSMRQPTLRFRLNAQQNGQAIQVDSDDIEFVCYPIFHAEGCSTFAPQTTEAIYQTYENGFIVWRRDVNEFIVVYEFENTQRVGWSEFSDTWITSDPDDSGLTPPAGLLAPTGRFGKLWTEHDDVAILGWATAPQQPYTMQYQTILGSSVSFDALHTTLPDDTILDLITASYENGGPSWRIID